MLTCLIACVGLALSMVDWEFAMIVSNRLIAQDIKCPDPENPDSCSEYARQVGEERLRLCRSNFVRVVILFSTMFGVVTLYLRHSTKSKWLNEDLPFEVLNSMKLLSLDYDDSVRA